MTIASEELDQKQRDYKTAVDVWVAAIRYEEALASVNHSVAEVDQWEHAAAREEAARSKAKREAQGRRQSLSPPIGNRQPGTPRLQPWVS